MKEKFYFYFSLLEVGKSLMWGSPFILTLAKKFVKVEKYFSPSKEIQICELFFHLRNHSTPELFGLGLLAQVSLPPCESAPTTI